jgi:hypothetical protein
MPEERHLVHLREFGYVARAGAVKSSLAKKLQSCIQDSFFRALYLSRHE